jgi:TRAP transporter TAXI family solute receptor
VIEEELQAAFATIRARLARATEGYAIAAGPEHGQYLRFAQALGDGDRTRIVPLITRGGEENLRLLRDGKVSLALAQGDAALQLYEGKGSFAAEGPYFALRAIGSLYPEPLHVLVQNESSVASMEDLKGRPVVIGQRDSASRTMALRVLEAHGLGIDDITPVDLALGDALVALQHKQVDAVIQVIGVPADSIRDALAAVPLRLVPLSENAVAALVDAKAGYFAFTIPKGAYANQAQDVRTVATAALLLAAGLSDSEVDVVTRFIFEKGRDFAARGSAQGTQVSVASARQGLLVPLHTAAGKALDAMSATKTSAKPSATGLTTTAGTGG